MNPYITGAVIKKLREENKSSSFAIGTVCFLLTLLPWGKRTDKSKPILGYCRFAGRLIY